MEPEVFDFTDGMDLETADLPDIPLKVRYQYRTESGWEIREQDLTARGEMNAGIILKTIAATVRSDGSASDAVLQFLRTAMVTDKDRMGLEVLLTDTAVRVEMDDLVRLSQWLLKEYQSGRDSNVRKIQPVGRRRPTKRA